MIDMDDAHAVHYWTQHLNISKQEQRKALDKWGNSAAAIRGLGLKTRNEAQGFSIANRFEQPLRCKRLL